MGRTRVAVFISIFFISVSTLGIGQQVSSAVPSSEPAKSSPQATADLLYNSGQFFLAAKEYEKVVAENPDSVPARAGVIRSYLKGEMVKEASAAADESKKRFPTSSVIQTAMGEVLFRRGEIAEAEREFIAALKGDAQNARARLGLAGIYRSLSLYGRASEMLKTAHEIAPDDPDIGRSWLQSLPRKQRIQELEKYLSSPKPDDAEGTEELKTYLAFLKALDDQPKHNCELVTKLDKTETKLEALLLDPQHLRGWGLKVGINDRKMRLLLDTGASGITISRTKAEKAGIVKIAGQKIRGIGDKGPVDGFTGLAESITIGDLEFRNCVVDVIDRRSVADEDGLIGTDVFADYLINIDYPGRKLKLNPLPKRPDDTRQAASLKSEGDSAAPGDQLPKDAYVAPEMKNWTKIFRFGHMMLIPTLADGKGPKLFLIDTGASHNSLSTEFAREVAKVDRDNYTTLKGISGSVKDVYQADKVLLQFARFRQQNEDVLTFDLSGLGRSAGTEVSGILGFNLMFMLEVKIDYRDGLVDFVYDPQRSQTQFLRTR